MKKTKYKIEIPTFKDIIEHLMNTQQYLWDYITALRSCDELTIYNQDELDIKTVFTGFVRMRTLTLATDIDDFIDLFYHSDKKDIKKLARVIHKMNRKLSSHWKRHTEYALDVLENVCLIPKPLVKIARNLHRMFSLMISKEEIEELLLDLSLIHISEPTRPY